METLCVGDLILDTNSGWVQTKSKSSQLTPRESELLGFLMRGSPRVYSQDALCGAIFWPAYSRSRASVVREYVWRLRRKIEDDPVHPTRLVNVRGFGYRIVEALIPLR